MKTALLSAGIVALAFFTSPAFAGQGEWQEVLPDVRVRLIAMPYYGGDRDIAAAIEIDMPETHNTYWRISGQAGFPAEISYDQSIHVAEVGQEWPIPQAEERSGLVDYVYRGHAFLPITVSPSGSGRPVLSLSAFLGICADLCMPVDVNLELVLDEVRPDAIIAFGQALAEIPSAWPYPAAPIAQVTTAGEDLVVTIPADSGIDPHSLVVASRKGALFGPARSTQAGAALKMIDGTVTTGDVISLYFRSVQGVYTIEATVE